MSVKLHFHKSTNLSFSFGWKQRSSLVGTVHSSDLRPWSFLEPKERQSSVRSWSHLVHPKGPVVSNICSSIWWCHWKKGSVENKVYDYTMVSIKMQSDCNKINPSTQFDMRSLCYLTVDSWHKFDNLSYNDLNYLSTILRTGWRLTTHTTSERVNYFILCAPEIKTENK